MKPAPSPLKPHPPGAALCRDCAALVAAAGAHCPDCDGARLVSHAELGTLAIAHLDCDAFYAAVEKRDRPDLLRLPLIVGHPGGRGVVTTACYIARRFGVRSAMPMFEALQRCPDAVVIPPDMAKYREASAAIREIMAGYTDLIEPVSLDEAYLDLGEPTASGHPPAIALARIAARVEREVGVTVSLGLAPNKLLAKLASDLDKPRGFAVIGRAEARAFLAPLPVQRIHGIGAATAARLEAQGIRTVGDVAQRSESELVTLLGRFGRRLAAFAQGVDDRAVVPARSPKSVSAETTFRQDIAGLAPLAAALEPLCARVASQLVRKGVAAGTVVLKLKTARFQVITRNRRLTVPTQRAAVLFDTAVLLLRQAAPGGTFRLIGVGAGDLQPASEADPPDLFGPR